MPRHSLAAPGRVAELPAVLAGVAAGPQRVQPPGPRLHRPRGEQEGHDHPGLPAAGHELAALGGGPLPALAALRQRHRGRQAAPVELAEHGRGHHPLHPRRRDLGVGLERRAGRPRRGDGVLRRHPHAGDDGRGLAAARAPAGAEGAGGQRGRPDAATARDRAPARHVRRRIRRAVPGRPAGDLRLPRLPLADPPADLPPARPRQPARPRLQGGRHHHHPLRYGDAERPGPLPPGHGRDRPGSRAGGLGRARPAADGGQAAQLPCLHPRARRGRPRDRGLEVAVLSKILVVNAGSRSLKLRVLSGADEVAASADLDPEGDIKAAIEGFGEVHAVGHRIVHGGDEFSGPVLIDPAVRERIGALTDLAPLHQPKSLAALDAVTEVLPGVPAVACFDTAFHATIPPAAATFALPAQWRERWSLRRFGFHGLSHAYVSRRAADLLGAGSSGRGLRLVSCHLGAGASLAAVRNGRSVDTTMGFTPLDGLVMATRSGSVDPGLVLWLQTHAGIPADELSDALENRSGLVGLAGTPDLREILARAAGYDAQAELAREVYLHRLGTSVGAMPAAPRGLDAAAL